MTIPAIPLAPRSESLPELELELAAGAALDVVAMALSFDVIEARGGKVAEELILDDRKTGD